MKYKPQTQMCNEINSESNLEVETKHRCATKSIQSLIRKLRLNADVQQIYLEPY